MAAQTDNQRQTRAAISDDYQNPIQQWGIHVHNKSCWWRGEGKQKNGNLEARANLSRNPWQIANIEQLLRINNGCAQDFPSARHTLLVRHSDFGTRFVERIFDFEAGKVENRSRPPSSGGVCCTRCFQSRFPDRAHTGRRWISCRFVQKRTVRARKWSYWLMVVGGITQRSGQLKHIILLIWEDPLLKRSIWNITNDIVSEEIRKGTCINEANH